MHAVRMCVCVHACMIVGLHGCMIVCAYVGACEHVRLFRAIVDDIPNTGVTIDMHRPNARVHTYEYEWLGIGRK